MTSYTATSYEYMTVRAPETLEPLYRDAYRNFGWTLESTRQRPPVRPLPLLPAVRSRSVALTFKRDRALKNRSEIAALQRDADVALARVAKLERSKTRVAVVIASVVGVVGAGWLAASLFVGATAMLGIVLGTVGLVWWAAGAVAFFAIRSARTRSALQRIEAEQDAIFDAGQRAARLAS